MLDGAWTGEYMLHDQLVHKLDNKRRVASTSSTSGSSSSSTHLLDDLTVARTRRALSYRDIRRASGSRSWRHARPLRHGGEEGSLSAQLSGGQQQLVAVARAMIHKPSLILADEPTGNLHSSQAKEIMELFKRLNGAGTTIIQVTHSEENAQYGNRIINLKGRLAG